MAPTARERAALDATSAERAAVGCQPLVVDPGLTAAAGSTSTTCRVQPLAG